MDHLNSLSTDLASEGVGWVQAKFTVTSGMRGYFTFKIQVTDAGMYN